MSLVIYLFSLVELKVIFIIFDVNITFLLLHLTFLYYHLYSHLHFSGVFYFHRNKATGDPACFTAFLEKHGVSQSEVPRFVGNRWNIMFKMSHTLIKRQTTFQTYLEKFCKKDAIRKDLVWGIKGVGLVIIISYILLYIHC